MPVKDIFDKPFDEGTIVKLEIFEKYFEHWLPAFVHSDYNKPIQLFDFFAGSGYDKDKTPGSPIRIIDVIKKHSLNLKEKNKSIHLYFNDIDSKKIDTLQKVVLERIKKLDLAKFVNISLTNLSFSNCLTKYNKELNSGCNLIFIDQNGFKEVNEPVFQFLINLGTTEFIFFISSTHIHRFAGMKEVQTYHPKFDFEKIKSTSRKEIHNIICDEFKKYVPPNINSYGLIPFSIMKNDRNNVYGLIFVSKHPLGADKFLHTVWKQNVINGNANYDIDEENQFDMFKSKKTKIEKYQTDLRNSILNNEIKNNKDAYFFTLNHGHLSQHANEEIKRMKKEGLISFESSSSLVNYDMVIKEKRILEYKILTK